MVSATWWWDILTLLLASCVGLVIVIHLTLPVPGESTDDEEELAYAERTGRRVSVTHSPSAMLVARAFSTILVSAACVSVSYRRGWARVWRRGLQILFRDCFRIDSVGVCTWSICLPVGPIVFFF